MSDHDVVICGAGIAGASLAAALAEQMRVVLIEAEDQPGYHSTGRSAAFWAETYGGPDVQPLTTASGAWLAAPPPEIAGQGFLERRGALHIARAEDAALVDACLDRFAGSVGIERVGRSELQRAIPGLRPEWEIGIVEASCAAIDVGGLHGAFLRQARRQGAKLVTGARLQSATRRGGQWTIATTAGELRGAILVNAAGAWADEVASLAGVAPVGIQPYRRTIVQCRTDPVPPPGLPLILDISEQFYFKEEGGGRLWISPHDETASEPCDAAPEEIDVAIAIDRFTQVVDWRVLAAERRWAGLRSFAPDRLPVYGFDPDQPGFFWCAGQGGFGIQTAPAAAKLAAALLLGTRPDPMVAGIDPDRYTPGRFRA